MDYVQLNLLEMLHAFGEDRLQTVLSHFICPRNKDVESFIQTKAIEFARQKIAMTYLVFSNHSHPELLGYFTLANKFVSITANSLSRTLQKRISKFSQYDENLNRFLISMPLIAQLGRNFNPDLSASITGQELLQAACDKVQEAQLIIGGKTVYIECDGNPKLYDFYSASQFVQFGQRKRDSDEIAESAILIQMLKYFRD